MSSSLSSPPSSFSFLSLHLFCCEYGGNVLRMFIPTVEMVSSVLLLTFPFSSLPSSLPPSLSPSPPTGSPPRPRLSTISLLALPPAPLPLLTAVCRTAEQAESHVLALSQPRLEGRHVTSVPRHVTSSQTARDASPNARDSNSNHLEQRGGLNPSG